MSTTIEMDLYRDLAANFRQRLVDAGYAVPANWSDREIVYAWSNVRHRIPHVRPRRVHRSAEFTCPGKHAAGLAIVEDKLLRGETIHQHLSRRVNDLEYHDALLNDWDIQHLHLGTTYLPNGLIKGTGEILYCIIEPDDAYFIQVMDHHRFSEPELLEIVNANWPKLLVRVPLFAGTPPTAAKVKQSRAANVVSLITLRDGTVVAPRGGGCATSGHSVKATTSASHWGWLTDQWESMVRSQLNDLIADARQRNIDVPARIRFVLWENNNVWHAVAPELEGGLILPTA
jgi:hypothetical protein